MPERSNLNSEFINDSIVIGVNATTEKQRREALRRCQERHWLGEEIVCYEREEHSADHWGWCMYTYPVTTKAPRAMLAAEAAPAAAARPAARTAKKRSRKRND
jgi:hypothetical protein